MLVVDLGDENTEMQVLGAKFVRPNSATSNEADTLARQSSAGPDGLHTVPEGDDQSLESVSRRPSDVPPLSDVPPPSMTKRRSDSNDDDGFSSGGDDMFDSDNGSPEKNTQQTKQAAFKTNVKSRLSLSDFTKQASENDLKSLHRRANRDDLSDDEKSVESEHSVHELTEDQLEDLKYVPVTYRCAPLFDL